MRKRLTMALAAGALVAAMVPGVASAEAQNPPCQFGRDSVAELAQLGLVDLARKNAQDIHECVQDWVDSGR